jgi:hypothetical protein
MDRKLLLMGALVAAVLQFGCASIRSGMGLAPTKPDRPACKHDGDCPVPVYVSVADDGSCTVQVPFGKVTVAKGKKPKVVWAIDPLDPADPNQYRFEPSTGVVILGNDPALDFNGGSPQGNHKFNWKSVNLREKSFDYTVDVQRRQNASSAWVSCALLDPRIFNEGP